MINPQLADIARAILIGDADAAMPDPAVLVVFTDHAHLPDLFYCAKKISDHCGANRFQRCAIVNAKSGRCAEDCGFCAQSGHYRTGVPVHAMLPVQALVERGLAAEDAGATHFSIVTSGTAVNSRELDTVCRAVAELGRKSELVLCASLGQLDRQTAQCLTSAGLARYHHNLETAPSLFSRICTTHTYQDAVHTVLAAKAGGLEVCCGGILGMGETWEQRIELARVLADLDVDGVPVNFLVPIPGTRLGHRERMNALAALASIAIFRFILPRKPILVCGGRESVLNDFQSWIFHAGASGLMLGNYLTTAGRDAAMDMEMLAALALLD